MKIKNKTLLSFFLQLIVFNHYFNSLLSLSLSHQIQNTIKSHPSQTSKSLSRQSRQILPTNAILLPNVGQYLALIQILVLKLVIWTQIMRLLGQDYVGKGIKSSVPLSEQQDLDEILDYDDLEADIDLADKRKKRKKRTTLRSNSKDDNINIKILEKFKKNIKLKTQ